MKILSYFKILAAPNARFFSKASEAIARQNDLFNAESNRQANDVGRIEKIEVECEQNFEKHKYYMNKNLSTPFDVARHISDWMAEKSALALLDDKDIWDMNRPFENSCTVKFLMFNDAEPYHVNRTFWKSCSFLLGAVISQAFVDKVKINLHSFPSPQISSGSFLHDAKLSLDNWEPTPNELRVLSAEMVKLSHDSLPLERLKVSEALATAIFSDNPFKLKQIPDIASTSDGKIILYRVGNHIDISKGPMIGNTSFIGRCSITAVHKIESPDGPLYRFQGVALPKGLMLNHFAYGILEERASRLNTHSDKQREQLA